MTTATDRGADKPGPALYRAGLAVAGSGRVGSVADSGMAGSAAAGLAVAEPGRVAPVAAVVSGKAGSVADPVAAPYRAVLAGTGCRQNPYRAGQAVSGIGAV